MNTKIDIFLPKDFSQKLNFDLPERLNFHFIRSYNMLTQFLIWFMSVCTTHFRKNKKNLCTVLWKGLYIRLINLPLTSITCKSSFNSFSFRVCGMVFVTTIFLMKLAWVRSILIESPENNPCVARICTSRAPNFLSTLRIFEKNNKHYLHE